MLVFIYDILIFDSWILHENLTHTKTANAEKVGKGVQIFFTHKLDIFQNIFFNQK